MIFFFLKCRLLTKVDRNRMEITVANLLAAPKLNKTVEVRVPVFYFKPRNYDKGRLLGILLRNCYQLSN